MCKILGLEIWSCKFFFTNLKSAHCWMLWKLDVVLALKRSLDNPWWCISRPYDLASRPGWWSSWNWSPLIRRGWGEILRQILSPNVPKVALGPLLLNWEFNDWHLEWGNGFKQITTVGRILITFFGRPPWNFNSFKMVKKSAWADWKNLKDTCIKRND